jgi:hypothetical protein
MNKLNSLILLILYKIYKILLTTILFLITYYMFRLSYSYIFEHKELVQEVIISTEDSREEFTEVASELIRASESKYILCKITPSDYKAFYDLIHVDYYLTYIYPLLTETYEDKLIRIAYDKYHIANMDNQLYLISKQNKIVVMSYLGWTALNLFSYAVYYPLTVHAVAPICVSVIGMGVLFHVKFLLLDEELYYHLLNSGRMEDFLFNNLPNLLM